MKLHQLLFLTLCAMFCASANAQLSSGDYYIQHVQTGLYLNAANDYGTRASLLSYGQLVTVTEVGDNLYTIDTHVSPNNNDKHFLGLDHNADLYFDIEETQWQLSFVEDGVYRIGEAEGTRSLSQVSGDIIGLSANADAWRFVTRDWFWDNVLINATMEHPVDATLLIGDPGFGRGNLYLSRWQGDQPGKAGEDENNAAQFWGGGAYNKPFHCYQTITGLPNGCYTVSCKGFYRYNNTDVNTNDVAIAAHANGEEVIYASLWANDQHVPFCSIADEASLALIGGDAPMQVAGAVAAFAKGAYTNELLVHVTDGTLTIAIDKPTHPGCDWTVIDDVRLTFYGESLREPYVIEIDGITYDVNYDEGFAQVRDNGGLYAGDIVIPDYITTPEGIRMPVTRIWVRAFQNCSALTSIVIPNSVEEIYEYAFENCTSLRSVKIGSGFRWYATLPFINCPALEEMTVTAKSLPTGNWLFGDRVDEYVKCVLYVPFSVLYDHKHSSWWGNNNQFADIRPIEGSVPANYLYGTDVNVYLGDDVMIPVCLKNNDGIVGFEAVISLPEGLSFVNGKNGKPEVIWNIERTEGHTIRLQELEDGSIRVIGVSLQNDEFMGNDGELFYIHAVADQGVAAGTKRVNITEIRYAKVGNNESDFIAPDAIIDVTTIAYTLGDVNNDGEWTIIDVTKTIELALDKAYLRAADMNGDGEVSVIDVVRVIEYALNKGPANMTPAKRAAAQNTDTGEWFVASDITLDKNGEGYLVFSLENTATYNAFQLDIALPEGFRFGKKNNGKLDITLEKENRLDDTHTAATKLSEDGRVANIIVSSLDNEQIYGNDGELFRVKIQAENGLAAGSYSCQISDIRFTDNLVENTFPEMVATITVDNPVSIGRVKGESKSAATYLLDGREVRTATRGIYIINGEKVVVK